MGGDTLGGQGVALYGISYTRSLFKKVTLGGQGGTDWGDKGVGLGGQGEVFRGWGGDIYEDFSEISKLKNRILVMV